MQTRMAVVAVSVGRRRQAAAAVNEVISSFGDQIIGRIGVPYRERGISVIALIAEGDTDTLGALSGRLGMIDSVRCKVVYLD